MIGRPQHTSRLAVAWAAGLVIALGAVAGASAQGVPPPPAPRLPPVPPLPLFGPPTQTPLQGGRCGPNDWTCRIDMLERRVADLEHQLERDGGRGGGGRRGRSVDMTVEQDCIFDSCSGIATKLCTDAGFARGVPIQMRQNGSWQRLVRATCLD